MITVERVLLVIFRPRRSKAPDVVKREVFACLAKSNIFEAVARLADHDHKTACELWLEYKSSQKRLNLDLGQSAKDTYLDYRQDIKRRIRQATSKRHN